MSMYSMRPMRRRSMGESPVAACPQGQISVAGICLPNVGNWTTTPTQTSCPSGSIALPGGYCVPSVGTWTSSVPCPTGVALPNGLCSPTTEVAPVSGQVIAGGQQVTVQEQSWWSKQTDTTKAMVIGGGALAALGLVLLMTSGKSKGPAIVYTSGQPR